MEPRSRETTPTKEDLEFIVDDGIDIMRILIIFQTKKLLLKDQSLRDYPEMLKNLLQKK